MEDNKNISEGSPEVNPSIISALNKMTKDEKQAYIFEKSIFSYEDEIKYEEIEQDGEEGISDAELHAFLEKRMISQLTEFIIERNQGNVLKIKDIEKDGSLKKQLRLMVLSPLDLRQIVEYCIRATPDDAIKKIKSEE